jgi:hypothetical protein
MFEKMVREVRERASAVTPRRCGRRPPVKRFENVPTPSFFGFSGCAVEKNERPS